MKNIDTFKNQLNDKFNENEREIIFKFFIVFARFECALKESNFCRTSRNYIEPDWKKFVESIQADFKFDETFEISEAVKYLLQHPPKIQNIKNDKIIWEERIYLEKDSDIVKLSKSINTVRNNLFHGGKFNGDFKEDDSRNYQLLKNSLLILNEWVSLDETVKSNFLKDIG